MQTISLAYSPCPNDTFIFHAWVHGLVSPNLRINPVLADIQTLNKSLLEQKHLISKASINCLGRVLNNYILLPVGAALGYGCGPKIVAQNLFDISDLSSKRIAIPGEDTTAHLLLNLLMPSPLAKHFCRYEEIGTLIKNGIVDCGLIIHETRFTFEQQGFVEIVDLGKVWENRYHLPLPLGGVFAHRSLREQQIFSIIKTIQESLKYAWDHPTISEDYVRSYSQEKNSDAIRQHIDLYVTQESYCLSDKGIASIQKLLDLARVKKLMPDSSDPFLVKF